MAQIEQISRLHDFLVFVFYVALIGIAMRRYALVLLTILRYPPTNITSFLLVRAKLTSKLLRLSQYLVVVTFVCFVSSLSAGSTNVKEEKDKANLSSFYHFLPRFLHFYRSNRL